MGLHFAGYCLSWRRSHLLVESPAVHDIGLSLAQQTFGVVWTAVNQHGVTRLVVDVAVERQRGSLRIKYERVLALGDQGRVVTEQRPMACLHGQFLLVESVHQVVAVGDAVRVGDDDGRSVVAFGFLEAESYDGPSIIIAYCHCIAHGYDLVNGCEQQKLAVDSGHWPLYRFDPRRIELGESPLQMDSPAPKIGLGEYVRNETRYRMVEQADPERFKHLLAGAQREVNNRYEAHANLARLTMPTRTVAELEEK